eukprot:c20346_g1_i1 orf=408-1103(-)
MKAHVCASRLLRLLPEVVSKKTNGQLSFLSSRALLGCRRKGAMTGLLLPGYPPSRNLSTFPAPLQACGTHKSSCLIPTLSATVKCSGDMADGLVEALMSFGASSVSIENGASSETDKEDNQNGPVAWSNEKRQFWNQCELIALFPPGQNVEECLASAFDSIGLKEALPYELSEVKHQNWEQQVKVCNTTPPLEFFYVNFLLLNRPFADRVQFLGSCILKACCFERLRYFKC